MDTVPIAVGAVPVRDGEWIRPKSSETALGGDNRAGCAVVLTAILEVLRQKLDYPPLTLLFTVQEETGLRGARYLNTAKLGRPELCFNWDGRDPSSLIIGAVGASNLSIRIEGIASHAGRIRSGESTLQSWQRRRLLSSAKMAGMGLSKRSFPRIQQRRRDSWR
ncbi:MAG UNVERIFIED_CONTAM: hypothetical protein LVR18_33225 [Planctomycetaceae bacterium]|jgi:tripeptide aminopeptidase